MAASRAEEPSRAEESLSTETSPPHAPGAPRRPDEPQPAGSGAHAEPDPPRAEPHPPRAEPHPPRAEPDPAPRTAVDGTPAHPEPPAALPGLPRLYFADPASEVAEPAAPPQAGAPPQPAGWQFGTPLPQPGQAWGRPARPARSRPPDTELRHRAIASLVFGLLALVAMLGLGANLHRGVYLLLFSAAVGLAAGIIGITALVKARRTGSYRPRGAVGGIVLGALACLLSVPLLVTYLVFPSQISSYLQCVSQAQSASQLQVCLNHFNRSVRP